MPTAEQLPQSPSIHFRDSLQEVFNLVQIHAALTGRGPGRRRNVEVLNKSAIILLCASFEAFIELLAAESFRHLVEDATHAAALPKSIRQGIAESVRSDKNELRMWDLADDGWKRVGEQYKTTLIQKYTGPFNSPSAGNIDELIKRLIGMRDVSAHWTWNGMSAQSARERLKEFISLRGALAHGQKPAPSVSLASVRRHIEFLARISIRSSNEIRSHCHTLTGTYPWRAAHYRAVR